MPVFSRRSSTRAAYLAGRAARPTRRAVGWPPLSRRSRGGLHGRREPDRHLAWGLLGQPLCATLCANNFPRAEHRRHPPRKRFRVAMGEAAHFGYDPNLSPKSENDRPLTMTMLARLLGRCALTVLATPGVAGPKLSYRPEYIDAVCQKKTSATLTPSRPANSVRRNFRPAANAKPISCNLPGLKRLGNIPQNQ